MPTLHGNHLQLRSRRQFHYWVTYDLVSESQAYFAGMVSEPSKGMFGSLDGDVNCQGTLPVGADHVPIELAIRSRIISHIERTEFGQWKSPPPSWPGWYGPYL